MKRLLLKEKYIVVACVLLFVGLIFASVMRPSVWHDEGYTAVLVENSYGGIIERTALDVHPPLYYLALKTWSFIVGDSVLALRLYSAVCMLAALLITWRIIRKLYGIKAGLAALACMAVGPFLIRYGQELGRCVASRIARRSCVHFLVFETSNRALLIGRVAVRAT